MSAMLLEVTPIAPSKATRWTGRTLTGIAVLFLIFDMTIKLVGAAEAVEGTVQLGWAPHHLPILGAIQAACLALYLIPRTAPLGAVLWTGYLGGAIATHVRISDSFTAPLIIGLLVWGGLYLRDARVRALLRAR